MDYIQDAMNRQQVVMELLTAPSDERMAETPAAAAVRNVLAAAAETVRKETAVLFGTSWTEPAAGNETRAFDAWDAREGVDKQPVKKSFEEGGMAIRQSRAPMRATEEQHESGLHGKPLFTGEMEEPAGAAVSERWFLSAKEEKEGRLSARELSLEIERDARRYDGGYQMY